MTRPDGLRAVRVESLGERLEGGVEHLRGEPIVGPREEAAVAPSRRSRSGITSAATELTPVTSSPSSATQTTSGSRCRAASPSSAASSDEKRRIRPDSCSSNPPRTISIVDPPACIAPMLSSQVRMNLLIPTALSNTVPPPTEGRRGSWAADHRGGSDCPRDRFDVTTTAGSTPRGAARLCVPARPPPRPPPSAPSPWPRPPPPRRRTSWSTPPRTAAPPAIRATPPCPAPLRDAVSGAAGLAGADTITFDSTLSGSTITLTSGPISVSDSDPLTISGPGAGSLTVSGGGRRRSSTWCTPTAPTTGGTRRA